MVYYLDRVLSPVSSFTSFGVQLSNHLSQCDQAMGFFHVQVFDQPTIDDDHPLALCRKPRRERR